MRIVRNAGPPLLKRTRKAGEAGHKGFGLKQVEHDYDRSQLDLKIKL